MFVRRSSIRTNYQGQQDEEILRGYNIPLTLYDITQSSTEEYNRHLASLNYLTPEQLHIIKDIRRRGKNKVLTVFLYLLKIYSFVLIRLQHKIVENEKQVVWKHYSKKSTNLNVLNMN
jgi:hypothetical protein